MTESDYKKLAGTARLVLLRNARRFLHFMDPAERKEAEGIAREFECDFDAFGGYEDAERQIGCFFIREQPQPEEYPLICLKSVYDGRFSTLTHRDVLGAYMGLGLTRACLGDIIITDCSVYLFAEFAVAPMIEDSFRSAGKSALCFSRTEASRTVLPAPKGTYFRAVLSSLRLDAVIAAGYRISRTDAANGIRAGNCKLNYAVCEKTDTAVSSGAMLSLKGRGRVRLVSVDGMTQKNRISVTYFRYE